MPIKGESLSVSKSEDFSSMLISSLSFDFVSLIDVSGSFSSDEVGKIHPEVLYKSSSQELFLIFLLS